MGLKVDREAVATLVLPQLWTMSMGPCMLLSDRFSPLINVFALSLVINVAQFQRFMEVIKKLGDRVEREHLQHLKDSQRIEDKSGSSTGMSSAGNGSANGLDFASLVAGASTSTIKPDIVIENGNTNGKSWDDDVWGSLLNDVRSFFISYVFDADSFASEPTNTKSRCRIDIFPGSNTACSFASPPGTSSTDDFLIELQS